jgi:hypothetical protein
MLASLNIEVLQGERTILFGETVAGRNKTDSLDIIIL